MGSATIALKNITFNVNISGRGQLRGTYRCFETEYASTMHRCSRTRFGVASVQATPCKVAKYNID